jgi:maltose/moltooligosaccharide transporter
VLSLAGTASELSAAIAAMPRPMKQLAVAMLFQWYAMFAYWQYVAYALARAQDTSLREAALLNGQLGGLYNAVAFIAAFAMVPLVRRAGARPIHALCVAASGAAMLALPMIDTPALLVLPMIGIGLGWASMMGNPYVMLANSIPPERNGVYMGLFNMFIVVPMLIESLTMPLIYRPLLGGDPRNVLVLAGAMMLAAAAATLLVQAGVPARRAAAR